ncbi:MFS transporter [Escherichia sp. E2593]|uniref:MFS transporter n=1 Tax=unclassified Escherichia TaxID=2608889 RepID=UPI001028D0CD|nr:MULTISPECIES: MFS transporter [unclassified Escherichia]RZN36930.1 MFS transporter [Escherichia sp. E10V5]TLI75937.1 MFS transporter [Escherichia sp. E2593]
MERLQKSRWAVTVLFFVNGFIQGGWAVQIAQLAPRFGADDITIGLLILTFGLGALFMMPLSGMLISRFGSQKVVRLFAVLASVSLISEGIVKNISSLVFFLFLLGAMIGSMNVTMNANAVIVERKLAYAILSMCHYSWSVGLFVSGFTGGYAVKNYGYLGHIFIISGIAFLLVLTALHFITNDHPQENQKNKSSSSLPRQAKIYIIEIMALLGMIPECAVVDWSSRYLMKNLNANIEIASLAFAFFACTMSMVRFVGDVIRDSYGPVKTLRVSSILAAAGMLTAALSPSPWQAILAFSLAGGGIANIVPVIFSSAGHQSGIAVGTGISIVTSIGYLGTLMAPAPIGFFAQQFGFPMIYIAMAFILVMNAVLAPLLRNNINKY